MYRLKYQTGLMDALRQYVNINKIVVNRPIMKLDGKNIMCVSEL